MSNPPDGSLHRLSGPDDYLFVRTLGSGTFGEVHLAVYRWTGERVAIKLLPRGRSIDRNVEREVKSQSSISHPHVVRFRSLFLTPTHLAIVMEYVPGGDLYHYVATKGALPEDEARWLFQQLVIAVEYCHSVGVVNRDIKPENAMLDLSRGLLKLTDFGYAKREQDSLPKSAVGTPGYAAPEVMSNAHRHYSGQKADTWSCGVLLYVLLFHKYPFESADDPRSAEGYARMVRRMLQCDYMIPASPAVSPECRDLLINLIVKDPAQRFGTAEIMSHPWFRVGLPPGWHQLNSKSLAHKMTQEEQDKQDLNEEWIDCVLAEARLPMFQAAGHAGVQMPTTAIVS